MGDRAHYVIKDRGFWERYYSQWGGCSIELDMLAGPEFATRFARGQRPEASWMNEIECVGAALIDRDERRLLWFSRHLGDAAYRAGALAVMESTWRGWRVDWAYDGLSEIVGAVGEDPRQVRRWRTIPVPDDLRTPVEFMAAMPQFTLNPEFYPPDQEMPRELPLGVPPLRQSSGDLAPSLVTIVRDGELRAYTVGNSASVIIEGGVDSLDAYQEWSPVTAWEMFPDEGVHLDADRQTGGVWTFGTLDRILHESGTHWPGWQWTHWKDRYREHLDLAAEAISLPEPRSAVGLRELAEQFDEHQKLDSGTQAVSGLLSGMDALKSAAESAGMQVSTVVDNASAHRPMDLTADERAAVHAAFAALR